jgi:hypothetical protein
VGQGQKRVNLGKTGKRRPKTGEEECTARQLSQQTLFDFENHILTNRKNEFQFIL